MRAILLLIIQVVFTQNAVKSQQKSVHEELNGVRIGHQIWSAGNLDVETFRNGDAIPFARSAEEWVKAGQTGTPAWCYYQTDSGAVTTFGRMYNWFAVNDKRGLAPKGWHVASHDDWVTLEVFLGVDQAGALLMKEPVWNDASGDHGTPVFPGGYRGRDGHFTGMGEFTYMASATEAGIRDSRNDQMAIWGRGIHVDNKDVMRCALDKQFGLYVRCVKDVDSQNQ